MVNVVQSNGSHFALEGISDWKEKKFIAQLFYICQVFFLQISVKHFSVQVGGVIMPLDKLIAKSLRHWMMHESFILLDDEKNVVMLGGHQEARVWKQIIDGYLSDEYNYKDIFHSAVTKFPEMSTKVQKTNEIVQFDSTTMDNNRIHPWDSHENKLLDQLLRKTWKNFSRE